MPQQLSMPVSYVSCTAAEGQCPLREHCLRSKVYRESTEGVFFSPVITVVNFKSPQNRALTNECKLYRTDQPKRFARGMKHIFDLVPKMQYKAVQQAVQNCFGCRRTYFYCKKGEQLISPGEQTAIANVFQRHRIDTPPHFDDYVECLDWE
jgi:hypothetical protein